jgi:hypothetical protein
MEEDGRALLPTQRMKGRLVNNEFWPECEERRGRGGQSAGDIIRSSTKCEGTTPQAAGELSLSESSLRFERARL